MQIFAVVLKIYVNFP